MPATCALRPRWTRAIQPQNRGEHDEPARDSDRDPRRARISWAGLAAGLIALLTIPGDYLLFHRLIPGGVVATTLTLAAAAAVAMMFAAIGAGLAILRPRSVATRWVFRLGGLTVAWHTEVKGHEEPLSQVPL
jgi:hypothetical protein